MKSIKFTLVICILFSQFIKSQWIQVSTGIENRTVYSLTSSSNNIFAGTSNNGLYISSNGGLSWTTAGTGLYNRIVFSLTNFGGYLYAGTDLGVWRTSNNGAYWSVTSINNNSAYSLTSNQSRVFTGLHNSGVFYSTGGTGWMLCPLNAINIKALVINGDFIAAGVANNSGVFISSNNGANWTSTALNYKSVYSLALNGNNIFAGTGSGVYVSTDNGTSWVQSSLNNELIYSLTVSGNNIYAGTELHGVYVSSDNGSSWVQKNEGLGNAGVNALYVFNNYIYAGVSGNGVFKRLLAELVGVETVSGELPNQYTLSQNYPNPFNPTTKINFSLPKTGMVKLNIYDVSGKEVFQIVNEILKAGKYSYSFEASGVSSGVYFYSLKAEDHIITKKMTLIK